MRRQTPFRRDEHPPAAGVVLMDPGYGHDAGLRAGVALEQEIDCDERRGADEQRSRRAREPSFAVRRLEQLERDGSDHRARGEASMPAVSRFGGARKQPSTALITSAPPLTTA